METQPLAYDISTAASLIGIGRTKLYEEIGAERIRTVKVGKRHLVTRAALEEYVAALDRESESALVGSAPAR